MIRHVSALHGVYKVDQEYKVDYRTATEWQANRWATIVSTDEEMDKVVDGIMNMANTSTEVTRITNKGTAAKKCGCTSTERIVRNGK